jgi:hypothetical protein
MAYVAVRDDEGTEGIGTAFHVGDDLYVTCRHVIEGKSILGIHRTEPMPVPYRQLFPNYPEDVLKQLTDVLGQEPTFPVFPCVQSILERPFYHPDSAVDLAVVKLTPDPNLVSTPSVKLGHRLDDRTFPWHWTLSEAVILGYPPIPFTTRPNLVAVRAEINALVQLRGSDQLHFILSAMPRGGFSGGLVISEYGFALGVVSQSLISDHSSTELGFFSVMSGEDVFVCLAHHKILPEIQKAGWGDFWNTRTTCFLERGSTGSGREVASISFHDDGNRLYVDLACEEHIILNAVVVNAPNELKTEVLRQGQLRLTASGTLSQQREFLQSAILVAEHVFIETGYFKSATLGHE